MNIWGQTMKSSLKLWRIVALSFVSFSSETFLLCRTCFNLLRYLRYSVFFWYCVAPTKCHLRSAKWSLFPDVSCRAFWPVHIHIEHLYRNIRINKWMITEKNGKQTCCLNSGARNTLSLNRVTILFLTATAFQHQRVRVSFVPELTANTI